MSVGEKIAAARKAKGWSQEALGEQIGVSVQAVSKWENDQSNPDRERLMLLSKLLGLSVEELIADMPSPGWELGSPYYDPDHMYTFVKAKAQAAGLTQTLAALPFMREKHGDADIFCFRGRNRECDNRGSGKDADGRAFVLPAGSGKPAHIGDEV